jgi:hypothetical protein
MKQLYVMQSDCVVDSRQFEKSTRPDHQWLRDRWSNANAALLANQDLAGLCESFGAAIERRQAGFGSIGVQVPDGKVMDFHAAMKQQFPTYTVMTPGSN